MKTKRFPSVIHNKRYMANCFFFKLSTRMDTGMEMKNTKYG